MMEKAVQVYKSEALKGELSNRLKSPNELMAEALERSINGTETDEEKRQGEALLKWLLAPLPRVIEGKVANQHQPKEAYGRSKEPADDD